VFVCVEENVAVAAAAYNPGTVANGAGRRRHADTAASNEVDL